LILRGVDTYFYEAIPAFDISQGRFLSRYDVAHARYVTVLGLGIAETLFPNADPIGRTVRLNGLPFEVVGVFERDTGLFGTPGADQVACIPYTTFERLYPELKERVIAVSVRDPADLRAAEDEVVTTMRRLRRVRHGAPNDFEIFMPDFAARIWNQVTAALVLLTGVITSITLAVGGIGVMNIMLISVTERTSEIGLRKAAGARRSDIRAQFLIEAVLLASLGGVIGILCGSAMSWAINAAVPQLPTYVSPFWVAMGLAISASVGVFFGYYPANRAAGLDPIACLRYE
jgi:putative ABC transport system permease protein